MFVAYACENKHVPVAVAEKQVQLLPNMPDAGSFDL